MNIYVSNLSFNVIDEDLKAFFEEYGEVSSARVITDKYTGRSRGFGFVEMPDEEQAKKAITELDKGVVEAKANATEEAQKTKEEAGKQADECQKKNDELNKALKENPSKADRLKKEKEKICTQNYSGAKEAFEPKEGSTEEEANQQAAAAEESSTGKATNANFGGASDAKVATEMPADLGTETADASKTAATTDKAADTAAATTTAAEADKASDATIKVDGVAATPEAQKTTVSASEMIKSGKIPTDKNERAQLALQYAREKGLSEEETQALMRTIYRENQGLNTALCNPTSSACGIGQYTNGTWNERCTKFGSRGSFQAQMDCLINDVSNRYTKYKSGAQTCNGASFDTCNYIQHYAGSFSAKAIAKGYVQDALSVINKTSSASANFFAKAAGALGGDVSSILASMKTAQETGLGGTIAQTLGFTGGNNGGTTTQGLVSQFLGMNNGLANTSAGNNTIGGGLDSLLSGLFGGGSSNSGSGSNTGSGSGYTTGGTSSSGTETPARTLVSTHTTVNTDGSIKTVQLYSDGLTLTSQTASNSTTTVDGLVAMCGGGTTTTSTDAFMLMISKCVAALKS